MAENTHNHTDSRLDALDREGFVVVVTKAFGPNSEDLMDREGPSFSGEAGVKLFVKQGDLEGYVVLSPYFGDASKTSDVEFKAGEPCELFVDSTGVALDKVPGMSTENGGEFFAVYLTAKLAAGEMVAINNIWGDGASQMLSEGELLAKLAEKEDTES